MLINTLKNEKGLILLSTFIQLNIFIIFLVLTTQSLAALSFHLRDINSESFLNKNLKNTTLANESCLTTTPNEFYRSITICKSEDSITSIEVIS